MQKYKWLLLGAVGCGATLLIAQTLPPTLPAASQPKYAGATRAEPDIARRSFHVKGKTYLSALTWEQVKAGREWKTSAPLPLTLEQAEAIARRELRKFVSDEPAWQVTDFSISRFRPTDGPNWYYALTLKPELWIGSPAPDTFTVLMNASGEPGKIEWTP